MNLIYDRRTGTLNYDRRTGETATSTCRYCSRFVTVLPDPLPAYLSPAQWHGEARCVESDERI